MILGCTQAYIHIYIHSQTNTYILDTPLPWGGWFDKTVVLVLVFVAGCVTLTVGDKPSAEGRILLVCYSYDKA